MSTLPNPKAVAVIIPGGDEDPVKLFKSGKYTIQWGSKSVSQFRHVEIPHIFNKDLCLPTLYLHFLPEEFRMEQGVMNQLLRAGNDMSEVMLRLPSKYTDPEFAEKCGDLKEDVSIVIQALQVQGEAVVGPNRDMYNNVYPTELYFSLRTARPKADVNLDKKAFGIPEKASQYLFVNNHASVVLFDERTKEAFNRCIAELPEVEGYDSAQKFSVFLKVFFEGGFGYNEKITMGTGYLPVNRGTAAMSVVPAFEGQSGIGTGYPYQLPASFLPFTETVPISIDAISSMSERHGRYGLCFTRCVYVWEGDKFKTDSTLDFTCLTPYGGFFYVPAAMKDHQQKGGYVYAFGESASEGAVALDQTY